MPDISTQQRIGIDLGGTKIEGVVLAGDGAVVARKRVATPHTGYRATIEAIVDLVAVLESRAGVCRSIGVGTPGALSPVSGLIKNANSTCLIGHPLDVDLAAALRRPVRVANDANCFALSEAVDGAGAGAHTVFGVIMGTGIGAGLVVNQYPLTGANAIAGEWGHNPLPWPAADESPGPECYCGQRGCIETFLSGPGVSADHARATGQSLPVPAIVRLAEGGDPSAEATLARHTERAARALAQVINLLDPDVIVLGGGLSKLTRLYQRVPQLWARHIFSDFVATRLLPPRHGDASGVRGAAWLWSLSEL